MLRQKRLITFVALFFILGFYLFGFIKQQHVVPILMYHSVNSQKNPAIQSLIVSPETFEKQMRFLKNRNYNVITLEALSGLMQEKKKIPDKTIAITFDDGYKDNFTHAFPILKKYNFPATVFLIFNEVGRPLGNRADTDARLSWEEIKIMQGSGLIAFGSHTLGPEPLIDIKSDAELKRQIFDSKKLLEEKLGVPVGAFSYPGGRFNGKIENLVKEAGYKFAVATSPGREFPADDLFLLKRIRVSEKASNLIVFWFETSGFYNFFKEKRHR